MKLKFSKEDENSLMKKIRQLAASFAVDSSSYVGPIQVRVLNLIVTHLFVLLRH